MALRRGLNAAVRRVAVRSYGVAAGYEAAAYVGANPDFTYAAQQQPQQLYGEQVQGGAELIYYGEYNRDCANVVAITGRIGKEVSIRAVSSGRSVAATRIAVRRNSEDEAMWFQVDMWSPLAEEAAAKLQKGQLTTVHGYLKQEEWTDRNGVRRENFKIVAESIGVVSARMPGAGQWEQQDQAAGAAPQQAAPWDQQAAAAQPAPAAAAYGQLDQAPPQLPQQQQPHQGYFQQEQQYVAPVQDQQYVQEPQQYDPLYLDAQQYDEQQYSAQQYAKGAQQQYEQHQEQQYEQHQEQRQPQYSQQALQQASFGAPLPFRDQLTKESDRDWLDVVERFSDWWDNREGKRNPKAPDFKHKKDGRALWLTGRNGAPAWALDALPPSQQR